MANDEDYTLLYVATDLDHFPAMPRWRLARDFGFNGKPFRHLDAEYYCWLRRQMEKAHAAFSAGHLSANSWDQLRDRFAVIHAWAVEHIGLEALNAANATLGADYQPPKRERDRCPIGLATGIDDSEGSVTAESEKRQNHKQLLEGNKSHGRNALQKRRDVAAAGTTGGDSAAHQRLLFVDSVDKQKHNR